MLTLAQMENMGGGADHGVIAETLEVIEIAEVRALLERGRTDEFSEKEWTFARSKSDPERRLAARLAAKRATSRLLGGAVPAAEIEVVRAPGHAPEIVLSSSAQARLHALGARRVLVSLTHGRTHAAAAIVLARD